MPLNGVVRRVSWTVRTVTAGCKEESSAPDFMTLLHYLMSMLPLTHLSLIVQWTRNSLVCHKLPETSQGEILKCFGILVLMTPFKFWSRTQLWKEPFSFMYISAPAFG